MSPDGSDSWNYIKSHFRMEFDHREYHIICDKSLDIKTLPPTGAFAAHIVFSQGRKIYLADMLYEVVNGKLHDVEPSGVIKRLIGGFRHDQEDQEMDLRNLEVKDIDEHTDELIRHDLVEAHKMYIENPPMPS